MIEFTWKSSRIEGNTYTLIETETLIKEQQPAKTHTREEAIMILNQKDAFDAILESPEHFRKLSTGTVENLHKMITKDLGISPNIRKRPVRIGASAYVPMDNPHQIHEALEQTISIINDTSDTFEKAFIALLMISYIQPFEDGNKRTARMLVNAVLAAGKCCPLSWRTVDETEYKKASVVFYETLSARYFKQLFVEQCVFAQGEYFPVRVKT